MDCSRSWMCGYTQRFLAEAFTPFLKICDQPQNLEFVNLVAALLDRMGT